MVSSSATRVLLALKVRLRFGLLFRLFLRGQHGFRLLQATKLLRFGLTEQRDGRE
jgi:hypothetical protein